MKRHTVLKVQCLDGSPTSDVLETIVLGQLTALTNAIFTQGLFFVNYHMDSITVQRQLHL